jgi:transcriptional regulator with XRE-family HTH domain
MAPQRADGVGARIAAARRTRGLTQAELARTACVSLPMVKAVERGARTPSDAVVDAIADTARAAAAQ